MRILTLKMTMAEAKAIASEIETATDMTESNPGPYHDQHHDAKRVLERLRYAIATAAEQADNERMRKANERRQRNNARVAALEPGQVAKCHVCRHRLPMHAKFNEHGWIRPACERCHGRLVAAAERAIAEEQRPRISSTLRARIKGGR